MSDSVCLICEVSGNYVPDEMAYGVICIDAVLARRLLARRGVFMNTVAAVYAPGGRVHSIDILEKVCMFGQTNVTEVLDEHWHLVEGELALEEGSTDCHTTQVRESGVSFSAHFTHDDDESVEYWTPELSWSDLEAVVESADAARKTFSTATIRVGNG